MHADIRPNQGHLCLTSASIYQKQLINFISLSNLYCISYIIECMAYVKSTDKLLLSPFLAYVEHGQGWHSVYSKKCFRDLMNTQRLYDSLSFPPNSGLYFRYLKQVCTLYIKIYNRGSNIAPQFSIAMRNVFFNEFTLGQINQK